MNVYDFSMKTIDGEELRFKDLKGKVLLVVNTASKCGFTPQYKELEELYKKLGGEKFEIIGCPCNQFANQEPGTGGDIKNFCEINYGVTFPITEKIDVKGPDAHPLFKYMCDQKPGLFGKAVKWNFTKFIIDSKGNVVDRFSPTTAPSKIEKQIVELIND